jgi:hypothetical protein
MLLAQKLTKVPLRGTEIPQKPAPEKFSRDHTDDKPSKS